MEINGSHRKHRLFWRCAFKKNGELLYGRILKYRNVNLRQLGEDRATEVKLGRFLSNERVELNELISHAASKTNELSQGEHVLAVQDTTEINHQRHANRVKDLGVVGNGHDVGFFLHPLLVLEAQSGACLGLGGMRAWKRTKSKQANYQKLPIEEKESYRWLETAQAGKAALKEAKLITIIADRESDIYEEWYRIPDERTHVLTRACHDRKLSHGAKLFEYCSVLPVATQYEIKVRARPGKRSEHIAKLEVRYSEVVIKRPGNCSASDAPTQIKLRVVDVREMRETVVGEEEPIHWCLLTTHDVQTVDDALQIVNWYRARWNIEQLFRILKRQGFEVEASQVERGDALIKLTVIALRAAVQTLQLTLARNAEQGSRPVDDVFSEEEVKVLEVVQARVEGKTQAQKNPHVKKTLSWAAWNIARLGGWKGYASERPPGPITMLRGQQEFAILCRGWRWAQEDLCIP